MVGEVVPTFYLFVLRSPPIKKLELDLQIGVLRLEIPESGTPSGLTPTSTPDRSLGLDE